MLSQMQTSRFLEGENKSGCVICADFYLSSGIVCKWKQELLQHALRAFDSDFGEKMGGEKGGLLDQMFFLFGGLSPNWWGGPSFSEYDLGGLSVQCQWELLGGSLGLCYLPPPPDE